MSFLKSPSPQSCLLAASTHRSCWALESPKPKGLQREGRPYPAQGYYSIRLS